MGAAYKLIPYTPVRLQTSCEEWASGCVRINALPSQAPRQRANKFMLKVHPPVTPSSQVPLHRALVYIQEGDKCQLSYLGVGSSAPGKCVPA